MNKVRFGIIGVLVGVIAVALFLLWPEASVGRAGTDSDGKTVGPAVRTARSGLRHVRSGEPKVARTAKPKPVLAVRDDDEEDDDDTRTPAEKALAARIEKALDDESLADALACAKEAQQCGNVEIRQSMVDTLGWFGEKALPELTPFLVDPDEDVRDSAMNEWSMAVSDVEDDAEKVGIVELAMNVLTDEEALEDISGEYIGVDEKLAVESLVRLIEANGSAPGVAKAKETYEFVTGDEWASKEAAAKWIAEEYQPDEP